MTYYENYHEKLLQKEEARKNGIRNRIEIIKYELNQYNDLVDEVMKKYQNLSEMYEKTGESFLLYQMNEIDSCLINGQVYEEGLVYELHKLNLLLR